MSKEELQKAILEAWAVSDTQLTELDVCRQVVKQLGISRAKYREAIARNMAKWLEAKTDMSNASFEKVPEIPKPPKRQSPPSPSRPEPHTKWTDDDWRG
jgi:hypothetical protein